MAYTEPRDWTDGEFVVESMMDTHIRDNFRAMGPHLIDRTTSDQTKSDTTLANATNMVMPVGVSEVWMFGFYPLVSGPIAADVKFAFTYPSGGTFAAALPWPDTAGTMAFKDFGAIGGTASVTNTLGLANPIRYAIPLCGVFVNSTTAGNVQLQWAQAAASGTTTMHINSTVWGVKLA